jgi:hypothetical protein
MSNSTSISHSLQIFVKEMSMILPSGETINLTTVFSELNFYESMFTPCRSGNVLITEALGLYDKINIQGNITLRFKLQKSKDDINFFEFYKEFKIYKVSNRQNTSSTSQSYILHFVNEDFVYSLQKKLSQCYYDSYSNIAEKILNTHLKVPKTKPSKGKSGINYIHPTDTSKDFIVPNLTPFDSLTWLAKRATSTKYKAPDFLFFENSKGYNFVPVSYLWEKEPEWTINAKPKNILNDDGLEFMGARDMKILSQFNMLDNIKDGSYAGTFVGFDTLTKTLGVKKIGSTYDETPQHANKNTNLSVTKSKDNTEFTKMFDSRIAIYPFASPRTTQAYIKEKSPKTGLTIDNTHEYIFQRKAFFSNLMQKRIELTMPGNFGYTCGETIILNVPKFSAKEDGKNTDDTLSGKYIILGVRHIIRYTKHETIIEIATDSTKK